MCASEPSSALLFKTHPAPGERLEQLGEALTPRVAQLPVGRELDIRRISASAGAVRTSQPLPAEGARGLTSQPSAQPGAQPKGGGTPGIDQAQLLRGLFGR